MRIEKIHLENYRGFTEATVRLGDFACLFGPNGIGKTSLLEAASLVCSSLDFGDMAVSEENEAGSALITPDMRRRKYLEKNIRNVGEEDSATGFLVAAEVSHGGQNYEVVLTHKGFEKNDIMEQDWWWSQMCYSTRFDVDMGAYVLPMDKWDVFARHWEAITGFSVDPDVYVVNPNEDEDMAEHVSSEKGNEYAIGFWMNKKRGRVHFRKASAGEKKIAKALSQIVCLPPERFPHVILVDNIEMHIHYQRHLAAIEAIKEIFAGSQIIATTHSTVIIDEYEPREHLIDVEDLH